MFDLGIGTSMLILGIIGAISGIIIVKLRQNDPKHWKDEAKYWEEQAKTWKGRYNAKAKQVIELDQAIEVTGEQDAGFAIDAVANALMPVLPDSVKKYIKDPKLLTMIANFAAKNPEIVNKLISGFVKPKNKATTNGNTTTNEDFA